MTESQSNNDVENVEVTSPQPASEHVPGHSVYTYASAGIAERKGNVPIWLWIVAVSLLIWGIYYLVTYWNAPVAPT
jgi:hypothetical protein